MLCPECIHDGQKTERCGHSGVATSKSYRCPQCRRAGCVWSEDTARAGRTESPEFCQFWCAPARSRPAGLTDSVCSPFCLCSVYTVYTPLYYTVHDCTVHYYTQTQHTQLLCNVDRTESYTTQCSQNYSAPAEFCQLVLSYKQ